MNVRQLAPVVQTLDSTIQRLNNWDLMFFPSADKKAKKDKHKVGQKKQQKAKKGSDADSDVSSGEDGYLDSKEMDYLSDSSSSSEGKTS